MPDMQGPEPTIEEQLKTAKGYLKEIEGRLDRVYAFCDARGAELTRMKAALEIISGAPSVFSHYGKDIHVGICRAIARRTLDGCQLEINEKGTIVYAYIPSKLKELLTGGEKDIWERSQ